MSFRHFTLILSFAIIITSCAKIGSPTGGAYDRTAPKIVASKPQNNSVKFKGNEFEVTFNEYIELDNVNENLIVSPPLKTQPTVTSSLRKMKVSWKDTLRDNTTYIFNFAQSIKDFTEGNKMSNFVYSFSTGDLIDTMEYQGEVIDAYTLKPIQGKYVMLYKEQNLDSIKHLLPNYITRCDSSGNFSFTNIAPGKYQILSIDDENKNLLFDEETEGVAFSLMPIEAQNYLKPDTISVKDSLSLLKDTLLAKDTTDKKTAFLMQKEQIAKNTLYFYTTQDTAFIVSSSRFVSPFAFQVSFQNQLKTNVDFTFSYPKIANPYTDNNYLVVYSAKRDTLTLYSLAAKLDSVKCTLTYDGQKQEIEQYRTVPKNEKITDTFSFSSPQRLQPYFEPLLLKMPLAINDTTQHFNALFVGDSDTVIMPCRVYPNNHFYVQVGKSLIAQNTKGKVIVPCGVLHNGIGQVNDSLKFDISVDDQSQYGTFFFTIKDSAKTVQKDLVPKNNYILLLEDMNGKTIDTAFANTNQRISFQNLKDGSYRIKIIEDRNNNKKWDCGSFSKRLLPEKVFYYEKPITIRKNWDVEEMLQLNTSITEEKKQ